MMAPAYPPLHHRRSNMRRFVLKWLDVVVAIIFVILFAISGWVLLRHPEVAMFDEQQQSHGK